MSNRKNPGPNQRNGRFSKAEKPKDMKGTITRLISYISKYKIKFLIVSASVLLSSMLALINPLIFQKMIDLYILEFDFDGIVRSAIIMLIIGCLSGLFSFFQSYFMAQVTQSVICDIRQDAFDKLQLLPVGYYDKNKSGVIMSKLTNDVNLISNSLSQTMTQLISGVITVFGALIMMFITNWIMAIIALLFIPLMGIVTMNVAKRTFKYFAAQQKHLGSLNSVIEESIDGLKVIKLYNQSDAFLDEFISKNDELKKSGFKAEIYTGVLMPLMTFMTNLMYAVLVVVGAVLNINFGIVSIGDIGGITIYAKMFTRPISTLAQLFNSLQQAIAGAERVFDIIDETDEYVNNSENIIGNVKGNVEIKEVNFSYEENKPVLKKVSIEAKPGETIAIVGPTGSGKTTIISLLNRFYDADDGCILVDDHNIIDLNKDDFRKKIGVVLQDTNLFTGSILENIKYGKQDATYEEVVEAAKLANADGFISRLPDGYETEINEGGKNFSQGERQLISIARTILSDPDILILDEATSSVDTRTEVNIQKSMDYLMKDRTSFVIAHRLQTIRNADKIIVLVDGEVHEQGSHSELMNLKGFYYDLYKIQFKGVI